MRFFHLSLPIEQLQTLDDETIESLSLTDARGKPVSVSDIREIAIQAKRLGYTFLPPCRECDSTGRCLGHPIAHFELNDIKMRVAPSDTALTIKPHQTKEGKRNANKLTTKHELGIPTESA